MNKVLKKISVNYLVALLFLAPVYSQTNNQIEIKVYDGYAYFNSSNYVPIDKAKVLYNQVEKYTDSLGYTTFNKDTVTDFYIKVSASGYEDQVINCSNACCLNDGKFEIFLGFPGAYYGYSMEAKRMPFDLRENSFCIFAHNEKTKSEVLALIPEKYHSNLTVFPEGKKNQNFLIVVDSIQSLDLKANDLFDSLRHKGARVYLSSKDLKTFIGITFIVEPCNKPNALFRLRNEISSKYPELKIELHEFLPSTWIITPPNNVLLDVFEWGKKIKDLDDVARIRMYEIWQPIGFD